MNRDVLFHPEIEKNNSKSRYVPKFFNSHIIFPKKQKKNKKTKERLYSSYRL